MVHIHVIHENAEWLAPLAIALYRQRLPWRDWFLDRGVFDLSRPPPEGVFYNRMSASSHTRDHRYAAELTAAVLAWLERHERRVVNGSRALDLEISKARQYAALQAAGIRTPDTIVVGGKELLVGVAREYFADGPFILKPNRGGKGLGVRLFQSPDALADHLGSPDYEPPVDGLHLLQQYVRAPEPLITRAEFIGGRFIYAVEVDTSEGFELCPADICAAGDAFCPAAEAPRAKFTIIDDIDPALKRRYEAFVAANDIDVVGIEFIIDGDRTVYTYDVNTNTNYNADAEARAGRSGMETLARYLGTQLAQVATHKAVIASGAKQSRAVERTSDRDCHVACGSLQ
jgi:glutathione synthase/RimK-type ligase-like ATP-grasp enzyme